VDDGLRLSRVIFIKAACEKMAAGYALARTFGSQKTPPYQGI